VQPFLNGHRGPGEIGIRGNIDEALARIEMVVAMPAQGGSADTLTLISGCRIALTAGIKKVAGT